MVTETEGREIPQEPVIKMAGEVRVEEIKAILGPGETDWFRRELFLLDYPEIAVRLSWGVQDKGPLKLRSVTISGGEQMKLSEDVAVVLDMYDGSVKFVNPVHEEESGNRITGIGLSTRGKLGCSFDILVENVPIGSRLTYEVQAANLATEKFREKGDSLQIVQ